MNDVTFNQQKEPSQGSQDPAIDGETKPAKQGYLAFVGNTYAEHSLVTLVLIGVLIFLFSQTSNSTGTIGLLISIPVMVLLTPMGISIGDKFRRFAAPDFFLASGMLDIFWKRLGYSYGPQIVGGIVFMLLSQALGSIPVEFVHTIYVQHQQAKATEQQTADQREADQARAVEQAANDKRNAQILAAEAAQQRAKWAAQRAGTTDEASTVAPTAALAPVPAVPAAATPVAPPSALPDVAPSGPSPALAETTPAPPAVQPPVKAAASPVAASTVESSGICQGLDLAVTPGQVACLDKKFALADKQLNDTYKQVMGSLDDSQKAALKKEQIAWIKKKEVQCVAAGQDNAGAQLAAVQIGNCKVQMTEQRLAYLKTFNIESARLSAAADQPVPPAPAAAPPVAKPRALAVHHSDDPLVDWANK